MRVTNSMLVNRMLLNMNRNLTQLDTLYNQLTTTKKISAPSDDPILAARALKFRTNVAESEQYLRNVRQGLSWMDTTEAAFMNTDSSLLLLRNLSVSASSDEKTYDDRQKIIAQMEQLIDQIGGEMNVQYAGRYVFSGYRTDQPPIFEADNNLEYTIRQTFNATDIESTLSYQKFYSLREPESHQVDIIKLPYSTVDNFSVNGAPRNEIFVGGLPVDVIPRSLNQVANDDAYDNIPDDAVVYIEETGEFILGAEVAEDIRSGQELSVEYKKTGFEKGELNPMVYFDCYDGSASYNMNSQSLEFEFGSNTRIEVNSLAKDVYTDKMYADLRLIVDLVKSVELTDYDALVTEIRNNNSGMTDEEVETMAQEQLSREKDEINKILHDRFNNMIGIIDKHKSSVSVEHTDMGSRYNRLELIDNRLSLDIITYKKLQSENEDADLIEVAMNLSAVNAAYQASLRSGASIIQQTLANYI